MGLVENLVRGFASAAGADDSVAAIDKKNADRRATAHEELEANTKQLFDDMRGLQQRKLALNPTSPTYQKDAAAIDAEMERARGTFHDLYHPDKNPGALQHLGGFLRQHLPHGPWGPPQAQSPQQLKESMQARLGQLDAAAATPNAPDNPILKKRQQMKEAGFTDEQIKKVEGIDAGLEARPTAARPKLVKEEGKGADGKPMTIWRNPSDPGDAVDGSGQPVPPEILAGFVANQKPAPGSTSKFAREAAVYENKWHKKVEDWSPEELSYFNQKQAFDAQHSGQSTTTKLEKDADGNIHPVEITSTRGPIAAPVDPHAGPVSKTPGEAKKKAAAVAPKSSVKAGEALPFKAGTPSYNKAKTEYGDAVKLDSIAKQVEQHPDDAVNQKRLAVALERISAGRFTTQALDYIVKAGIANSIEGWMNSASTGALPKDVMRQLIEGAHQNLKAAKDRLDSESGTADDDEFLKKVK